MVTPKHINVLKVSINDLTLYKSESLAVTKIPKEVNVNKFKMNLEHM